MLCCSLFVARFADRSDDIDVQAVSPIPADSSHRLLILACLSAWFNSVIVMTVLLVLYVRLVVLRAQERDDLVFRKALVYKQPDAVR